MWVEQNTLSRGWATKPKVCACSVGCAQKVSLPFSNLKTAARSQKRLQIVYKTAARGLLLKRQPGVEGEKEAWHALAGWLVAAARGQVLCREQKRASERHRFDSITRAPRALFHPFFERADCMRALSFGLAQNYHTILLRPFLRWLVPTFCAGRRGPCLRSPKIRTLGGTREGKFWDEREAATCHTRQCTRTCRRQKRRSIDKCTIYSQNFWPLVTRNGMRIAWAKCITCFCGVN